MKILARLVGLIIVAVFLVIYVVLLVAHPLVWVIIGDKNKPLFKRFGSFGDRFFDYYEEKFKI